MLILIFYFTLFSFLYAICFSWKFGRKGSAFFGILSNFLSLWIIISKLQNFYLDPTQVIHYKLGVWFRSELLLINWGLFIWFFIFNYVFYSFYYIFVSSNLFLLIHVFWSKLTSIYFVPIVICFFYAYASNFR